MTNDTNKLITYMLNQLSYAGGCLAIMETELVSGTCIDITSLRHLQQFIQFTGKELMQAREDYKTIEEINNESIHD